MKTLLAVAIATSIALAGVAGANETYGAQPFSADTPAAFQAAADNVRREMAPGGRYQYVKPDERADVDRALAEMSRIFAEHASIASMGQDTKVRLFNAQEVVNSVLQQRANYRVVCSNEVRIGSLTRVTTCHTYAQDGHAHGGEG